MVFIDPLILIEVEVEKELQPHNIDLLPELTSDTDFININAVYMLPLIITLTHEQNGKVFHGYLKN